MVVCRVPPPIDHDRRVGTPPLVSLTGLTRVDLAAPVRLVVVVYRVVVYPGYSLSGPLSSPVLTTTDLACRLVPVINKLKAAVIVSGAMQTAIAGL